MTSRVDEYTVGLDSIWCRVDGADPVGIGLDGTQVLFNGRVIPFNIHSYIAVQHTGVGDDNFVEIKLDPQGRRARQVDLLFKCQIRLKPISPRFLQLTLDDRITLALGPCPAEFQLEGKPARLMPQMGVEFVYQRQSGADATLLSLPFPTGSLRVWFHTGLNFDYLAHQNFGQLARVLEAKSPPGHPATTRLEAYQIQQHGMVAYQVTPEGKFDQTQTWETIVLTEAESQQLLAELAERRQAGVHRRQAEFEENCGCLVTESK